MDTVGDGTVTVPLAQDDINVQLVNGHIYANTCNIQVLYYLIYQHFRDKEIFSEPFILQPNSLNFAYKWKIQFLQQF
jgi:hypothetical protein